MSSGAPGAHTNATSCRPRRPLAPRDAAFHVLRRITAPAQLIFQFVEAVLAIGTITIELADGVQVVVAVGDEHRIFPDFHRLERFGKLQAGLAFGAFAGLGLNGEVSFDRPAGTAPAR